MLDRPIQALLVEDSPGDVRLLRELLGEAGSSSVQLTHTPTLVAALDHLRQFRFDVILLDLELPDQRGFATFAQTQAQAPQVPIIILTGVQDEAVAVEAVRQGAQDYLVKGRLDAEMLVRAMRHAIERKRIDEELKRNREHLAELVKERTAELRQANQDLQREIGECRQVEQQLRALLREKTILLQEIHHRVKNNLQVISSLLDMQALSTQDPSVNHLLQDSRNRVRAMALVHERLCASSDLSSIYIPEYIKSLTSYLGRAYSSEAPGVTLNVAVDEVSMDPDLAIPCGLLLNELVSNALKHAFSSAEKGDGAIDVELRARPDGQLTLSVSDNGIGLPRGLRLEGVSSLGLQLVSMLTQQLGGTLELDGNHGTAFKISFVDPSLAGEHNKRAATPSTSSQIVTTGSPNQQDSLREQ